MPNLPAGGGDPHVRVRLAPVEKPPGDPAAPRSYTSQAGQFRIHWRNVGTFLIRHGREIVVAPEPGVEDALIRLFFLGPVLAILLQQRGVLVLHASVVSVDGFVVGFMGEKGWGKSTTAAALNARGHALVADDILAITLGSDGIAMVQPGPPHFKLWPEAAAASFGDNPESLSRLHSQIEKRERLANTCFIEQPLPLRHLYLLERGNQLESISMPPAAALLALVRHSYLSGIMKSIDGLNANFRQCAQLAERIPVSALKRPIDLGSLGNIARLVEQDVMVCERETMTAKASFAR